MRVKKFAVMPIARELVDDVGAVGVDRDVVDVVAVVDVVDVVEPTEGARWRRVLGAEVDAVEIWSTAPRGP
jgi:hypothetical protein